MIVRIGDKINILMRVKNSWGVGYTFKVMGLITDDEGNVYGGKVINESIDAKQERDVVIGPVDIEGMTEGLEYNLYGVMLDARDSLISDASASKELKLTIMGDVNGDGKVNIFDLAMVGLAYGTVFGGPHYNINADFNNDGVINIIDLATVGLNYGKSIGGVAVATKTHYIYKKFEFYDRGTGNFLYGVAQDENMRLFSLGINENVSGSYVVFTQNGFLDTGIPRTIGNHTLELSLVEDGITAVFDGHQIRDNSISQWFDTEIELKPP